MAEHIAGCEKHPIRRMASEAEAAEARHAEEIAAKDAIIATWQQEHQGLGLAAQPAERKEGV
jgi:hypothetical protein